MYTNVHTHTQTHTHTHTHTQAHTRDVATYCAMGWLRSVGSLKS